MTPIQATWAKRIPNIHIDKIRILAPCYHKPLGRLSYHADEEFGLMPISADKNLKSLKDGGEDAYIRSKDINGTTGMANMIEIHCCPPLVLQKHNVFGHGNLQAYVYQILDLATKRLGVAVEDSDRGQWKHGHVGITEIHLTGSFACPYNAILPAIQAIDDNNPAHKRRPELTSITLDRAIKRRSKSHAVTVYDKWAQLMRQAMFKSPGAIRKLLLVHARKGIRAEVKMYSDGLRHKELHYVYRWKAVDISALFFEVFNKYDIAHAIQPMLTEDELSMLTRAERNSYELWLLGKNIKDQYGRTAAWKITKAIRDKTGIDVGGNRRPEKLPGIDLQQVFSPENTVPIPDWAPGSEYYAGPRGY